MQKYLLALLTAVPLIVACSTTEPTIKTGDNAEIILDRLHRVDNTSVGLAFSGVPTQTRAGGRTSGVWRPGGKVIEENDRPAQRRRYGS